ASNCMRISPRTPDLVVIKTTPLAAREPYIAAAEASFKISIDAKSDGLRLLMLSTCTPSTIYSGLVLLSDPDPRISSRTPDPGFPPEDSTCTPAMRPCNAF